MIRAVGTLARVCTAGLFVYGGSRAVRNPSPVQDQAESVTRPLAAVLPWFPSTSAVVRLNGASQVVAAAALVTTRAARWPALVLMTSLVPTTIAGHRFWEQRESAARHRELIEFLNNVSIFGGLLRSVLSQARDAQH